MSRDWNNFFKPEDFNDMPFNPLTANAEYCAKQANTILREELEKAATVYGTPKGFPNEFEIDDLWASERHHTNTHTAKLVMIEEPK